MADPPKIPQSEPSKMAPPPADSSFTPRKEFIPSSHIYSTFFLMTFSGSSLVRLYHFPPGFIRVLRSHLNERKMLTATRQDADQTCYEYTLDGRPWASPKSIETELLIVDLLHVILRYGYNFLSTIDYGRERDDKVAIAFSKPQPFLDRDPLKFSSSSNLGRGPSPLPNGSSATLAPQSPVTGHSESPRMIQTKMPFALSFASGSLLRVISPPLNNTPAILNAIRGSWPRGVVSEKKVGDAYEFKLKGYKWFQEDTFATDSLQHILTILSRLDAHAFTLLTSLTLNSRSRIKDLWIFTGAGPEIPDEPLPDRDSTVWPPPPGSSILGHSNSNADFHGQGGHIQVSSPLAGHRRLATVPDISANGEANGNGSPNTPTAAYSNGHRRSMTEPLPQIQTRQQSQLAQTVLRRPAPRTQWSQAVPAQPPAPSQGNRPPPVDMTGVGAFTRPGHLRNLSLGGQPSPSIIYATTGGRRNSEDDETVIGGTPRPRDDRDTFTFPNPLSPPSTYERRDPDLSALSVSKPRIDRSSAEVRHPLMRMLTGEKERGGDREGSVRTVNQGLTRSRRASSLSPGQELGVGGRRRSRLGSAPGPLVVQNPDPTPIQELRSNPMSPVGASAPELSLPGGFGEEREDEDKTWLPAAASGLLPPPVITTTPPADEQLSPPEFLTSSSPPLSTHPQSHGTSASQSTTATPSPPLLSPTAFRDSAISTGSRESGWTGTDRAKSIEIPIKWTGPPGGDASMKGTAERVHNGIREEDADGVAFPGGWAEQKRDEEAAAPGDQWGRDRAQSVPLSVTLGSDIDGSGTLGGLDIPGDRMSRSLDLPATEVERLRQDAKEVDARVSSPELDSGIQRKSSRGVVGMINSRGMSVLSGMTSDSKFNSFLRQDPSHPKSSLANGGMGRGIPRPSFGSTGGPPPSWLPKHLSIPAPLAQYQLSQPSRAAPAGQSQLPVRSTVQPPAQPQRKTTPPKLDNLPPAAVQGSSLSPLSPKKLQKSPSEEAKKEREKQLGHQSSISEGWVWINVENRDASSSQGNGTPRSSGTGQVKRAPGSSGLGKSVANGEGRTRKVSHEKGGKGKFFLLGRKNNPGAAEKKKLAKKAGPMEASQQQPQPQTRASGQTQQRITSAAREQPRIGNGTSAQASSRIPQRVGGAQRAEPKSNYRPARPS